jgi:putative endonuclease
MQKGAYSVYLVRCANGALYTGITTDVERRLAEHNAEKGARYTRLHAPVELVWTEAHPDRSSASKREAQIKRLPREKKLEMIRGETEPGKESGRGRG